LNPPLGRSIKNRGDKKKGWEDVPGEGKNQRKKIVGEGQPSTSKKKNTDAAEREQGKNQEGGEQQTGKGGPTLTGVSRPEREAGKVKIFRRGGGGGGNREKKPLCFAVAGSENGTISRGKGENTPKRYGGAVRLTEGFVGRSGCATEEGGGELLSRSSSLPYSSTRGEKKKNQGVRRKATHVPKVGAWNKLLQVGYAGPKIN